MSTGGPPVSRLVDVLAPRLPRWADAAGAPLNAAGPAPYGRYARSCALPTAPRAVSPDSEAVPRRQGRFAPLDVWSRRAPV